MPSLFDKIYSSEQNGDKASSQEIQCFWMGDSLSLLNRLSLCSYIKNGHHTILFVYKEVKNVPDGVEVRDANTIFPESEFAIMDRHMKFFNQTGKRRDESERWCRMHFSDLFRYTLLYKNGGWWSDLDVVCLKYFDFDTDFVFNAGVGKRIETCVIKCLPSTYLMKILFDNEKTMLLKDLLYDVRTVPLFGSIVDRFGLRKYVLPINAVHSIPYHLYRTLFSAKDINPLAYALHFYSSRFIEGNVDVDKSYHPDSIFEQLKKMYLF